jgi:hypothetical protein
VVVRIGIIIATLGVGGGLTWLLLPDTSRDRVSATEIATMVVFSAIFIAVGLLAAIAGLSNYQAERVKIMRRHERACADSPQRSEPRCPPDSTPEG